MNILEQGRGSLFTDPDPDNARAFFRTKSRRLENKEMNLADAIAKYVHDGEYLGIGGFGANRSPLMDFEPESKRMRVISLNPGYSFNDIQENCEFELLVSHKIDDTKPPTQEELCILREEVDPYRYVIGRN